MSDFATRLRPYRAVLGSRMRSQRSYRASFAVDLAGSLLVGLVELAEVWVLFHHGRVIGGLDLAQIILVFGLADLGFSLADLVAGHCDRLPDYVRAGTLDVFYLRPQPVLLQLITSDISLKRLARVSVGGFALVYGVHASGLSPDLRTIGLITLAIVTSTAIFMAQFVTAAGLQFFLINGAEMTNAFVYGGRYAASQPGSVWNRPLVIGFGFVFPVTFAAYLPALLILGLPGHGWLPAWLGWFAPLAALWSWVLAAIAWRIGIRHYQGGGG